MPSHRYPRDAFGDVGMPDLGMDTDTVPRMMSSRKAQTLKNFLMDRPGVLPMRGPLCEGTTWNLGASIGVSGVWAFGDKLLIARYNPSATNIKDYWTELYRPHTGSICRTGNLGGPVHYVIDLAAGSVTGPFTTGTTSVITGRGVQVGSRVYGIIARQGALAPDGNTYQLNELGVWDGSASTPINYGSAAPQYGLQDIAYHYNRLFILGGMAAGTIAGGVTPPKHALYWSDPFANDGSSVLTNAASAWQDDVSGLLNQIVVGSSSYLDPPVALAHVGANLCILKRRTLWMLYGTSPSNFSVKQVSNEVGCIDPRSVVEYNGGVYFMSERGFMFYDGARVQNVSGGLASSLVVNAQKQVGSVGVDGGYCKAALLDRGYILVTTGTLDGLSLTVTADSDAWLLHAPTGAWLQLSSAALPTVIAGGRTANNTWLMTDQKLVKANYLFAPQNAPAGTRGFDSIDSGATKFVIPSRWTTRALELSAPTSKSKLQRIMAEYYWGLANGGWTVTTTTRGATGVVSQSAVLGAPTTVAANLPARASAPVFNETDEVYFDVAATSSAPAAFNDAELHRLLVEYEPTGNTVPV